MPAPALTSLTLPRGNEDRRAAWKARARPAFLMIGIMAAIVSIATGANANDARPSILDTIEPGLWSLRMRDDGSSERMCVTHGRRLIQLRHGSSPCRQTVVGSDKDEITVQYSCPGQGFGRTHLRVESPRLVQVDAQGVHHNSPFAVVLEARRIGACDE